MLEIRQAAPLCNLAHKLSVKKVEYIGDFPWGADLNASSRAVVMCNHGPSMGPVPIFSTLVSKLEQVGLGELSYSMIAHPMVYPLPGAKLFLGLPKNLNQVNFDYYMNLFEKSDLNLLIVAPEGDHSTFGNGVDIEPFRSPRTIEIALRTRAKIIIYAARGSHLWQKLINIESSESKETVKKWFLRVPGVKAIDEDHLQETPWFSLPWITKRIPKLYVQAQYYTPKLQMGDLVEDPVKRRLQLLEEAECIRNQMQEMMNQLKTKELEDYSK